MTAYVIWCLSVCNVSTHTSRNKDSHTPEIMLLIFIGTVRWNVGTNVVIKSRDDYIKRILSLKSWDDFLDPRSALTLSSPLEDWQGRTVTVVGADYCSGGSQCLWSSERGRMPSVRSPAQWEELLARRDNLLSKLKNNCVASFLEFVLKVEKPCDR